MCSHGAGLKMVNLAMTIYLNWNASRYHVLQLRDDNVVQITSGDYHCVTIVDSKPSTIRQSQQASFNSKEHSDVVFMVENEPIYANSDVLSQKSDYFAAMFRS